MLSAGCPSSLLSLLSRMSVLVLLLSRTKRPKGNLCPSQPWSERAGPPNLHWIFPSEFQQIFSSFWLLWERLNLQWPIKSVVKLNSCILFSRTMSHWVFSGDDLQAALANRLKWRLARGNCQILGFSHRFPTFPPICIPPMPPYTQGQIKREKNYSRQSFPFWTQNVKLAGI